jgi:hypothetical protein
MVRKNLALPEETKKKPWRVPEPESERLPREHAEYWSPEAVERRARWLADNKGFHIRDDFRIVCDGIVDGETCGNNIGMAPLPDGHDGLCERCRNRRIPFHPRITLDPNGVVWGPHGDAYEG